MGGRLIVELLDAFAEVGFRNFNPTTGA